jgi:hypothetical protein
VSLELITIDVKPGAAMESQSGLQMLWPKIYGAFARAPKRGAAAIVMHPTSNFMGHYLLGPLLERGISALGLNSRYVANDTVLIMERIISDLGSGVQWLRAQGYERDYLIGNSGGGALVSFYQAQAEHLTIRDTPAGDPIDLAPGDLPPADGIILAAAHPGRARLMTHWIDPSVTDENDALSIDPALDMFNPKNGPPYSKEFLSRYRRAQIDRSRRIESRVRARLAHIRSLPNGPRDEAMLVYRTLADPRCLDPSIEPNDRAPRTTIWGDPYTLNYGVNSIGRYTSLTAYLSQWSLSSRADGIENLAKTSVPVLLLEYTADASVFPSDIDGFARAAAGRTTQREIKPGNHYLLEQPKLVTEVADQIAAWIEAA